MIELKPCPFCGAKKPNVRSITTVDAAVVICGAPDGCGALACACNTEEDAIKTWNTRASGWIPCSERLPEECERVLAIIDGVVREALYEYDAFQGSSFYRDKSTVTHWMPLPDPPEMNGGCNENHTDDNPELVGGTS